MKRITELFAYCHSYWGCVFADTCIHQGFRSINNGTDQWGKAIPMPTTEICHHDSDFHCLFQELNNKIGAFMDEMVFKNTLYLPAHVEELRNREDGKKQEGMIGCFHSEVHDNVGKANKEWVGNLITSHCQDHSFV